MLFQLMEKMFEIPTRMEKVTALGHGTLSRRIKRAKGTPSRGPVLVNHRQRIEIFGTVQKRGMIVKEISDE